MMKNFIAALFLTGIITAQQPLTPAAGYTLVYHDEFNKLNLSPDGSGVYDWYKAVWWNSCIPDQKNIYVSRSILTLKWTRGQPCNETTISTFAHDTKHGRSFRFGYYEARMMWTARNGAWPAFWMIPVQAAQGQEHTGEIDIFEGEGSDLTTFFGTAHEWGPPNGRVQLWNNKPNDYRIGNVDYHSWHTYGALWEPGKLTWYFDGRALGSTKLPSIFDQQDYFLVLSMQEGANWKPGNLSGVSVDQMNLNVDWVRVWQKK